MSEKINLDDLYTNKQNLFELRLKVYDKILSRVHKKIKTTARNKNNICFCCFVVPEFILGLPRYDVGLCTSYLIDKLNDNGFKVKYTHPNMLFISWQHYIPYYERQEYKKKTGISIDGFGNVVKKKKDGTKNNTLNNGDINSLLINSSKNQKIAKKQTNYKDTSKYKPSGKFIYDNKIIKTIENLK